MLEKYYQEQSRKNQSESVGANKRQKLVHPVSMNMDIFFPRLLSDFEEGKI
jgi:hypothetical protein